MLSRGKINFSFQILLSILVLLGFIYLTGNFSSASEKPEPAFVIDVPSKSETVFAEKRDFYVIGHFAPGVKVPGNIRIEVFRGSYTDGVPIRVIQSQVDEKTGMTPLESLEMKYEKGTDHGLFLIPDLVKEPGGILNPNNKVVVTPDYFSGLILGGATKDFDTTYTDSEGKSLVDLTAGPYSVKVTGLSGEVKGYVETKKIWFMSNHKLLGRFKPKNHVEKMVAYAGDKKLRMYFDFFPGYYWLGNKGYEVNTRWRTNNALEVVNTLPGLVLFDKRVNAKNDLVVYNIALTSATQQVELANIVKNELVDSPGTTFLYYDIGDPAIDYVDMKTGPTHKEGQIVVFLSQDRLVLTRAEIKKEENIPDENLSQLDNDIKIVDTDFSDGITVFPNDEFSIFGVVKPIPSLVKPTEFAYTYEIANRISRIHYRIKKSDGSILLDTIKDVSLGRIFDPSQPKNVVISLYEFKHEFHLSIDPGTYAVEMVGLDMQFKEVPETKEVFVVNSVSGNETKMPKNE